jgi:hypothetical protein
MKRRRIVRYLIIALAALPVTTIGFWRGHASPAIRLPKRPQAETAKRLGLVRLQPAQPADTASSSIPAAWLIRRPTPLLKQLSDQGIRPSSRPCR